MSRRLEANSHPANDQPVFIRAANPNDVPAILNIEKSAPSAAHWSADHYRSRILSQSQAACFLVAECHDDSNKPQLGGFLCARIVAAEWEVENVVVHPLFRRRRIATQLMQSLIENWDAAAGAVLLLEVRESNMAARDLYERHGFREVGRRPSYYRDPDESAVLYKFDRQTIKSRRVNS